MYMLESTGRSSKELSSRIQEWTKKKNKNTVMVVFKKKKASVTVRDGK